MEEGECEKVQQCLLDNNGMRITEGKPQCRWLPQEVE